MPSDGQVGSESLKNDYATPLAAQMGSESLKKWYATTPFTIFYAGALSHYQGVDILLAAFSQLTGNYRLVIAGIGPLREAVEHGTQHDARIEFLGYRPLAELLSHYFTGLASL